MTWTNWEKATGPGLDFQEVIYEKKYHLDLEGGVARIAINRPHRYNAMNAGASSEMSQAFYDASHDPIIGVIVWTGVGDHFGTGGDVEWEAAGGLGDAFWLSSGKTSMRMSSKPVIAMVKGYCIGGHNWMAYTCDFTVAADNAIFGQNGPRVSSPADGPFIPYLTRVVGAKRARELWMLCRGYTAMEAYEMGLVNKVVPLERLEEEVDKWCEDLLRASPGCLEILKAAFDQEFDHFPDLGIISSKLYPDWFSSPEGKEGGMSFLEKRLPRFWALRKKEMEARRQLWGEPQQGER
jgi:naphthoate synthase/2-ketocyclohexanecarboxyl-CoA hydrolase